ncbi:MAG: tRNA (guanosine(46)-N7)-methyltransferase TrmB [Spirochaetia bacterium]|nr:tRNA (guanosine(46)-N7)-methyltransferase TrmB [Spirochaetia bacterium]
MAGENESLMPARSGIRSYVLRAGRMTDAQRHGLETLEGVYGLEFDAARPFDLDAIFGGRPVVAEIGFGMGDATVEIAAARPDLGFLGIEVHAPGVGKLLSELGKRRLENVRTVRHDAVEVLEKAIAPGSLAGFHVFFPDPWPKKRHHKRRLVTRPFTDLMASRLAPGGYIHFVTDWEEYAEWARAELDATPGLLDAHPLSWAPRPDWRPVTKFERKAAAAGRTVRELEFRKA